MYWKDKYDNKLLYRKYIFTTKSSRDCGALPSEYYMVIAGLKSDEVSLPSWCPHKTESTWIHLGKQWTAHKVTSLPKDTWTVNNCFEEDFSVM